jgi:LPS-assembly protein
MVLNYIFVSATSMFICYKVCANIKPATIFFCFALFITLPLLANSKWKTKFQISLTVNTDTIPVKNIDTLSSKKIIADTLKPKDSTLKNSFDTSINDSAKRITVDTLLFSKDSLDAPVKYSAEDSGVLIIPEKRFILYGKANTDYGEIELNANTIKYDQQTSLITAYGGTDTSKGALNLPTFKQGDQTSTMDTVFYNL